MPRSLPNGRLVIAVGAEGAGLPQEVVEAEPGEGDDTLAGGLAQRGDRRLHTALRGVYACATMNALYGGNAAYR